MDSTPADRTSGSQVTGLGGSPAPAGTASAGGASIRSFQWVDADADVVGGQGANGRTDGTKDQHFRLELNLPPNAIIESMVITRGGFHRWVTQPQPGNRYWPIAIFQGGRPVGRSYVAQVGVYSGTQAFDLYVNTGIGIEPGTPFDLEVVLSIGEHRVTLTSHCKPTDGTVGPMAEARAPTLPGPVSPAPAPAAPAGEQSQRPPESEDRRGQRGHESNEVPTLLTASSGGASIVSFDWIDRDDNVVGMSGRMIAAGGGKDEHFRLVMDFPAAATIEEIKITGGGVLHWTTKPSARFWPVGVVANHELKNPGRAQSLRLGSFSGHWTFDLYTESHGTVRAGQAFGVEVVVLIGRTRHQLTARCQRH
jgi:hypothetical protein